LDVDSCFKQKDEIKEEFEKQGVNLDEQLTLYCGTGVTASVDLLALSIIGKYDDCNLYDGSWSEFVKLKNNNSNFRVILMSLRILN